MSVDIVAKPLIVKRIEQTEINEVSKLLSECCVLPVSLVKKYLETKDKNEKQIENILNQLVKRKLGFYDESKAFLKINKAFSLASENKGLTKSIYLLIDLMNNIEEYFVQTKNPHTLTFFNKTAEKHGLQPIYDVFYIPYGREQLDCYIVNEMANTSESGLNSFIILDSKEQINRLTLSQKVKITSFVFVSANGDIEYLNA